MGLTQPPKGSVDYMNNLCVMRPVKTRKEVHVNCSLPDMIFLVLIQMNDLLLPIWEMPQE